MPLPIQEFTTDRQVLEVKYDNRFQMWDNAGALLDFLSQSLPDVSIQDASPAQIQFWVGGTTVVLVESQRTAITTHGEDRDKVFPGYCRIVTDAIAEFIGVGDYNRVGYRHFRIKRTETPEEATAFFLDHGILPIPPERFLSIEGKNTSCAYMMRYEGESYHATLRMDTVNQKAEIVPPPEHVWFIGDPIGASRTGILLDIDYFIPTLVKRTKVIVEEFVSQCNRLVRRDMIDYWSN